MTPTVHVFPDLAAAESEWRRLEAAARPLVFQTWRWVSAWHAHVGVHERIRPAIVSVRAPDGAPWMLLPLAIHRRAAGRVLVFLGGELCDYHAPLIAPECPDELLGAGFPELWRAVLAALPRTSCAELLRLPPTVNGRPNPFLGLNPRVNPSGSHQATLGGDWQRYYTSRSSGRTRQADRRKDRRLADAGVIGVRVGVPAPEAEPVLQALFEQKSRQYRELGVPDLFAEERYRALVRDSLAGPEPLGHLSVLTIGGRIWATHWGLLYDGRYYSMLPAYARGELAQRSPGDLLRRRLLEECARSGVHTFDFTIGDEPYKRRWADVTTPLYDVLRGHTAWGHVCVAAVGAQREARRRVKASPRWYALARQVRARLHGEVEAPATEGQGAEEVD